MLENILKKLQCSSISDKYSGMEIERKNPLTLLSDEEMDYFEEHILPNYAGIV